MAVDSERINGDKKRRKRNAGSASSKPAANKKNSTSAVKATAGPPIPRALSDPPVSKASAGPPMAKFSAELPVPKASPVPPAAKISAEPPASRQNAQPPALRPPAPAPATRDSSAPARPDALRAYLAEVRQFKLLSREEEAELVDRFKQTGDQQAAQKLISSNLRLVVKIAMEFQSHWLNNLLDLIQEGNVGLMQALRKFDPAKGVKFSYYASYWIKAYILKYIMDNWRLVKVGTTQAQRKLFYNLRKERDKIMREGLSPAPKLLAERLGVAESEVEEMDIRLSAGRELSLDAPIGPDSEQTQISLLPSETEGAETLLEASELRSLVRDKLELFRQSLSEREKLILEKRLMAENPVTLQEIGEQFSISRERVRQLEDRLKKTLMTFLRHHIPDMDSEL